MCAWRQILLPRMCAARRRTFGLEGTPVMSIMNAPRKNGEEEGAKAKARAAERFGA
jgi:hypothetical protein